jgi:ABC-type multidrug transport system fused ATPase/permease subunit
VTNERADRQIFWRFLRTYLGPSRWAIALCMLVVSLSGASVYLMAYYSRIVVDSILVVQPQGVETSEAPRRLRARIGGKTARALPAQGLGRNLDLGRVSTRVSADASHRLLLLFLLYTSTLLVLNVLSRLAQRTRIRLSQRLAGQLREDIHQRIMELSLSYHTGHSPGKLLSRIVSDVEVIRQQLMQSIFLGSQCVTMVILGLGILLVLEWRVGLVVLAVMPVYGWLYYCFRQNIRQLNQETRHTNSCLYGYVSQKIDAMKAIQAYGREGGERVAFHRLAACFLRDTFSQQRLSAALARYGEMISGLCCGGILIFAAHLILQGNPDMSLGKMMYVYATVASLFLPVLQLTQVSVMVNNVQVLVHRVTQILERPPEIVDAPDARPFPSPLRQGIALRGISFRYDNQEDAPWILTDVSQQIPRGSWLCIMGASGCGKTTLLYLLSRLYEPSQGQILVDGLPLGKIRMKSLRNRVGFVPQEPKIFSGTIRDNICYGVPDASPKQIMAAARAAEMHDFIMDMPVKYETIIGEKGTSLSGGQRQRLSLARALITEPDVLILDDCTSALDADTEQKIQKTLSRILKDKTAIIVSQRVSMAMRCDRICVLRDGKAAESGTHAELVARKGFYARLHAQQTDAAAE